MPVCGSARQAIASSRLRPALVAVAVAALIAILVRPAVGEASPRPEPTAVVRLEASPSLLQILPGLPTEVLRYRATVESGPASVIDSIPGTYLGPTFHVHRGDRLRVHFVNHTGEPSTVHWHGLVLPDSADGHPRFAVPDRGEFNYEFTVLNRAGTYWYHPHPHMTTGPQVIRGLAGLFIVSDDEEQALPLPRGEYDVPVVIQDRTFTENNQVQFDHDAMEGGHWGQRIFVNGKPDYVLSAATRVYRLRLLNGSVSRMYKLAWGNGTPMTVIGTDGGLLGAPVQRPYVMLAPGERLEVWLDLGGRPLGSEVVLQSLAFDPGGMAIPAVLPNGAPFEVMRIRVDRVEPETLTLPAVLQPFERYRLADAVNAAAPRTFAASMMMGQWLLNGHPFQMEDVATNEVVRAGDLEAWDLTNIAGMNEMRMPHPIHVHGVQFQVIQRWMGWDGAGAWATVNEGLVDEGWKDTFLMMPGERVRFLVRFGPYPGLYLYHCHNLLHEDFGMMRNYRVEPAPGGTPPTPEGGPGLALRVPGVWKSAGPLEIRYDAPEGTPVSLRVVDPAGRSVCTLPAENTATGSLATWDLRTNSGRRAPAGLYLVQLSAGGQSIASKVVLLHP